MHPSTLPPRLWAWFFCALLRNITCMWLLVSRFSSSCDETAKLFICLHWSSLKHSSLYIVVVILFAFSKFHLEYTITSLSYLTTDQSQMGRDECNSAQQLPLIEDSGLDEFSVCST